MEPEDSLTFSQVSATCPYPVQSMPPHSTSWISVLILSSHLGLGLTSGVFPSGFHIKTLYRPRLSPIRATCPSHHVLLDFITRTILGEENRSLISSLFSFLQSPVSSSLLGPNILLSTLFTNTLSLRFSLNVSDQVSNPYKTTGKIMVLYIIIFIVFDSKLEDKRFCTDWKQAFPHFNLRLISAWIEFWSIKIVPKYLNSSTLSKELLLIFILWLRSAHCLCCIV